MQKIFGLDLVNIIIIAGHLRTIFVLCYFTNLISSPPLIN